MKRFLFFTFLFVSLFSCSDKDELLIMDFSDENANEYVLSLEEAESILIDFVNNGVDTKSPKAIKVKTSNVHMYDVADPSVNDVLETRQVSIPVYELSTVIDGVEGFTLVIGDKRIQKVLISSEQGSLKDTAYILGLKYYFKDIPAIVEEDLRRYYDNVDNATLKADEVIYHNCFLPTIWGQEYPYNAACPTVCSYHGSSTCLTGNLSGRCLAGCVPIAIAQIMAYHRKPTNLSWSSILVNNTITSSSPATVIGQASNLIAAIGAKCSVTYRCYASGVLTSLTPTVVPQTFKDYSYACDQWTNGFNFTKITQSILNNRPVYMQGNCSEGGHAWVCDSWKQHVYYGSDTYDYLHMNWGWSGNANGYYYMDHYTSPSFNTVGYLFNSGFAMLTNIR